MGSGTRQVIANRYGSDHHPVLGLVIAGGGHEAHSNLGSPARRVRRTRSTCLGLLVLALGVSPARLTASKGDYFGKVEPPAGQVLRYVTGSEPESLDPQVGTGQPEARIYVALFEGLTDYDPKTGDVAPGLAERWEAAEGNTVFTFHLREASWSDGRPITAHDFVYTLRRGPVAGVRRGQRLHGLRHPLRAGLQRRWLVRAPAGGSFVMDPENPSARFVVPGDAEERKACRDAGARGGAQGTQPVPVRAEDVGIEAVNDRTVRIRTALPISHRHGRRHTLLRRCVQARRICRRPRNSRR